MALTPAQKTIIKTHYNANMPTLSDDQAAAAFNALATPDFWIWRTAVTKAEIVGKVSQDATSFIWAGNGFITRTTQEILTFDQLFAAQAFGEPVCNPSLPNVRTAFSDIFSGVGNAALNRTHLLATGRRKATLVEKLLATGTGSTASPALSAYSDGFLMTAQDVVDSRNS
jgi:hypothetical protein